MCAEGDPVRYYEWAELEAARVIWRRVRRARVVSQLGARLAKPMTAEEIRQG